MHCFQVGRTWCVQLHPETRWLSRPSCVNAWQVFLNFGAAPPLMFATQQSGTRLARELDWPDGKPRMTGWPPPVWNLSLPI